MSEHQNPLAGGSEALGFREVAPRVWVRDVLPGQGNGMTIELDGLVQLDTGYPSVRADRALPTRSADDVR